MLSHKLTPVLVTLALLLTPVAFGSAQHISLSSPPGPRVAASFAPTASADLGGFNARLRTEVQPTYWLTGGIIGGGALGVLTGVFAAGMCAQSESNNSTGTCVLGAGLGAVVGGMLGFTVGALIGGQFHKPSPTSTPRGGL